MFWSEFDQLSLSKVSVTQGTTKLNLIYFKIIRINTYFEFYIFGPCFYPLKLTVPDYIVICYEDNHIP